MPAHIRALSLITKLYPKEADELFLATRARLFRRRSGERPVAIQVLSENAGYSMVRFVTLAAVTNPTSACSEQRGNQGTRTHAHTNNADSFGCPLCFCLYLPCSSFMHDWSARFFWESGACPCTFSQTVFELVYGGQCPRKRGAFISFSLITIGRTSLCLLPAVFCARNLR